MTAYPTLTRRHFEFIAETLKRVGNELGGDEAKATHERICKAFVGPLKCCNGSFNRDRFIEACGIKE